MRRDIDKLLAGLVRELRRARRIVDDRSETLHLTCRRRGTRFGFELAGEGGARTPLGNVRIVDRGEITFRGRPIDRHAMQSVCRTLARTIRERERPFADAHRRAVEGFAASLLGEVTPPNGSAGGRPLLIRGVRRFAEVRRNGRPVFPQIARYRSADAEGLEFLDVLEKFL